MMWRKEESNGVAGAQLGLFGDLAAPAPAAAKINRSRNDLQQSRNDLQQSREDQVVPVGVVTDAHMQAALRLAKAMKRAKYARSAKANGTTNLSASKSRKARAQRYAEAERRLGNAICDHLLASLREQVAREKQTH
jgi:hypothetical protein